MKHTDPPSGLARRSFCTAAAAGIGAAALAACRAPGTASAPDPEYGPAPDPARGYLGRVRDGALAWLESVRWKPDGWGRWKFNARMVRDYALRAGVESLDILDGLGALDALPEVRRREAVRFFQSCQDPRDGWFKDPLVRPGDRVGDRLSWERIWARLLPVTGALKRLGAAPLHPLPKARFIDVFDVPPAAWHGQLDWSDPRTAGEAWAGSVSEFRASLPADGRTPDAPALRMTFEAMEAALLDPDTGLPTRGGCQDPSIAMAGLFELAAAYVEAGRPLPYAERAVDAVLALQRPDGEFGGGGMELNRGALGLLRALDRQLAASRRRRDIAAAGDRCAAALLATCRMPDGGFARDGGRCPAERDTIRVSEALPESDTAGTRLALECLACADAWAG